MRRRPEPCPSAHASYELKQGIVGRNELRRQGNILESCVIS